MNLTADKVYPPVQVRSWHRDGLPSLILGPHESSYWAGAAEHLCLFPGNEVLEALGLYRPQPVGVVQTSGPLKSSPPLQLIHMWGLHPGSGVFHNIEEEVSESALRAAWFAGIVDRFQFLQR